MGHFSTSILPNRQKEMVFEKGKMWRSQEEIVEGLMPIWKTMSENL
jgi:hypothetical protein